MPDISINARFLTQPVTGVQRYAIELVKALDNLIENGEIKGYSFELLVPPSKLLHKLELKNIPVRRVGYSSGYLWEQLELPLYSKKKLLFCPGNVAPLISLFSGQKTVVTVHDLSYVFFSKAYSPLFRLVYRIIVPYVLKKADAIITVSDAEKQSIISQFCYVRDRIHVIHHGTFSIKKETARELNFATGSAEPYVLYVGSLNRIKNFEGVMKAAGMLNCKDLIKFVVVGACEKVFNTVEFDLSTHPYIEFKGQVNDREELIRLYRRALCFIFPSFYESFGLPAVEAMKCGCPVIVSNIGALREVCRDAALYCDPYNINDIAEKIAQVLADEALRKEMREKGFKQAQKFSWEKCAKETLGVFEGVLKGQEVYN